MTWIAKDIQKTPVPERLKQLPDFLAGLIRNAIHQLHPEKIWVFGSRARGDARETSDFDLAFQIPPTHQGNAWTQFYTDQLESPPSLHKYDLIDYDLAGDVLRKTIEKEGVLLYERKT